ncbi:MAG: peroxiredoxin [Acidobacteria bacterium]|nr:peroxiredoxin [Acidobacteriota bacterium]
MDLKGHKAPDFDLQGSDGRNHRLQDYAGKFAILYFYPRDNTPGCTKEACSFRDLNRVIEAAGAVVLGVSRDSLASHQRFISAHCLNFPLLSDPEGKVMKRYGAWGKKLMYGKTVEGVIRSTALIDPNGKVIRHWGSIKKAAEHPGEVLQALQDALKAT